MTPSPDVAGAESLAGLEAFCAEDVVLLDRAVPALKRDIRAALARITQLEGALREIARQTDECISISMRTVNNLAHAALSPAQPHQDASVKGREP